MENSINFFSRKIPLLECQLKTLWHQIVMTLLMFDRIRFLRLVSCIHKNSVCKLTARWISKVAYLIKKRFSHIKEPSLDGVIFNLSTFRLTEFESLILAHGLDFCVSFHMPDREKVFADIDVFYSQLAKLKPSSNLASSDFKAKLNSLAHTFSDMSVSSDESRWGDQHRSVIKSLRNNNNLVVSKSDKGVGFVLLDHVDYVNKMLLILNDDTKFTKLGPVETCDHTTSIEVKFQKQQRKWVKSNLLSPEISDSIRPVGSIHSRLYGLSKIHKDGVPLRPILSMVDSGRQKVSSWLSSVRQTVLEHLSCFCIKDSFSFSKIIRNFSPTDMFMSSFDVCSLYTNVPLEKTIEICCDVLFRSSLPKPTFPESVFKHLINFATSSVEFSFNNIMYRQIDGVAMASSLGPTQANIFVGFCEANSFYKIDCPYPCIIVMLTKLSVYLKMRKMLIYFSHN